MSNKLSYITTELGLEVIILNDGSAWVTQSSYARFSGKDQSVISRRSQELEIVEVDDISTYKCTMQKYIVPLIRTRMQNNSGSSQLVLIPAKVFGKWLIKDKPELADAMLEAGATQ